MKVALGIVHGESVNSWYHHSVVGFLQKNNPTHHVFHDHICIRSGPLLSAGRGVLAGQFLENTDADALLTLDSDMVFEPERIYQHVTAFEQIREQHPDVGVLGGLAFISADARCRNPLPNVWVPGQHEGQFLQLSDFPRDSLIEVGATGAACLIIAREVLEKFAGEKVNPYHHIPLVNWPMLARNVKFSDDIDQIAAELKSAVWRADQCGEDISFCMRVRDAGYKIFLHTSLIYDHAKSTLLGVEEFDRARTAAITAQEAINVTA